MSIIPGGDEWSPPPLPVSWDEIVVLTAERIEQAWDSDSREIPKRTLQGAQIVWEHVYGYLRGRIPYPVPVDLMGVSVSAGLRVCKGLSEVGALVLKQGQYADQVEFKAWIGFLAVERMTLDRYRRRTA